MKLYQQTEPISCIVRPNNNKGGIYQGNIDAARNCTLLMQYNIGAVLTVAAKTGLQYNEKLVPYH